MAEKEELLVFRILLGIAGIGLGAYITIAELRNPYLFEDSVPIFLPAIIGGLIGAVVGVIIDKIVTAIRNELGSRPAPSYSSSPHRGARQAPGSSRPRFCDQCGVDLSASAKFCGACGHKVGG